MCVCVCVCVWCVCVCVYVFICSVLFDLHLLGTIQLRGGWKCFLYLFDTIFECDS